MHIPFLCVFLAFLINYLTKIPVGMAMMKMQGGYNNRQPREQQAELSGWGRRALGAHLNSFEVFPAFAAAVIIAQVAGADGVRVSILSIIFVVSRLVYVGLYLADKNIARSAVWFVGMLCIGAIFVTAIF